MEGGEDEASPDLSWMGNALVTLPESQADTPGGEIFGLFLDDIQNDEPCELLGLCVTAGWS